MNHICLAWGFVRTGAGDISSASITADDCGYLVPNAGEFFFNGGGNRGVVGCTMSITLP